MPAPELTEAVVYVLVDAAGDYAIGTDEAEARESYEQNVQALSGADGFRLVRVVLQVPRPEVVELTGTVPALESTPPLLTVA